ncbi:MAG: DUF1489 family protein, partial [Shimia sp.]
REAELLRGGSLYWVIKGVMTCRQTILRLEEVDRAGTRYCGIVLAPEIVRVAAAPRRPFQGWRYLKAGDAPPDLSGAGERAESLPPKLELALAEIGVL